MHNQLTPFHLAIQVRDLTEAREFYGNKLGLEEGRSSNSWIDFNCYGHQLVTHLNPNLGDSLLNQAMNMVDGKQVPICHFGVVLENDDWEQLAARVGAFISDFLIEPHTRFKGKAGEQGSMFFLDPSGNALEFKTFKNIEQQLFAK